jgi:serine/threonine protein phosphatase PrpC
MHFDMIDSLSLPGDPSKANEDSFTHNERMAVVFDGATGLGDSLMPGPSDAAWIAQFAGRRLRAHAQEGDDPAQWLRAAAQDAEKSFKALRRRAPKERYEIPVGSLMQAALIDTTLHFAWFGDCAALLREPTGAVVTIGDTLDVRAKEAARARQASQAPAADGVRAEFLPALRISRNRINKKGGDWLFAPQAACADHAKMTEAPASAGARLLIASDGFFALAADYGRYSADALLSAAEDRGLDALGRELRAIESDDPDGRRYPRYKRSDDATALLLSIAS